MHEFAWQVYGFGLSEQFLGEFMKETGTQPIIATKFAPLPWRFTSKSVVAACRHETPRLPFQRIKNSC
jgi:aryl-alcohol dehydrogenase-like predicted oxidoreductase